MFLIFHLDRLDVLPVEDLGLGQAMARLYGLDPADRVGMARLGERWRPSGKRVSLTSGRLNVK